MTEAETVGEFTTEVPIWPALIAPVLRALEGSGPVHRKELFDVAADKAELSAGARRERLATGGLRYEQRMGWVLSHATRAGWVDKPARATYSVTPLGLKWLAESSGALTYSEARELFAPHWPEKFKPQSTAPTQPEVQILDSFEPVEQIEDGIQRVRSDVGDQLLDRLRNSHPAFFERAVISLLLAMGYGGADERGRHIGGSNDGGVDGVIDEDALGLDRIYIQAKRYQAGSNISREMIQAFVGALAGVSASKGVFISTSNFTAGAKEYAASIASRVILIDSQRLVDLMIDYGVGVQTVNTYTVVEIDEDFFDK